MRLRDGDRWGDVLRRLAALPPPIVNGAPRTPQLDVRFPHPDDRHWLPRARQVTPWLSVRVRVVL